MHYGPDYNSENKSPDRGNSFFAVGPTFGGYIGAEYKRTNKKSFEIGINPYITPLFSINDPDNHYGVVIGGLFDFSFRF
ncbi:MAG: hypothetical protein GY756_19025 [bacterium]|nr:hypothetical protein [bacterium]